MLWQYDLPPDRIAQYPADPRHQARLLVYQPGSPIQEAVFLELDRFLPADWLLIYNNSRVVPARLVQDKKEVLLTEPVEGSWQGGSGQWWHGFYRPGRFWRKGGELTWTHEKARLTVKAHPKGSELAFYLAWEPAEWPLLQVLELLGAVPLPPYLRRTPEAADRQRYQTIYARVPGAIAAPTAGLHFTEAVLDRLRQKGISYLPITLHVGAGTFQPIQTPDPQAHPIHAEAFHVPYPTLKALKAAKQPIVAVGTTSLRVLESLYWLGLHYARRGQLLPELPPFPWREVEKPLPVLEALNALPDQDLGGYTRLYILPGYPFQLAQGLITNFHQPGSTLIGLVQAFIGKAGIQSVYEYALAHGFRFLSYGDASLLWR